MFQYNCYKVGSCNLSSFSIIGTTNIQFVVWKCGYQVKKVYWPLTKNFNFQVYLTWKKGSFKKKKNFGLRSALSWSVSTMNYIQPSSDSDACLFCDLLLNLFYYAERFVKLQHGNRNVMNLMAVIWSNLDIRSRTKLKSKSQIGFNDNLTNPDSQFWFVITRKVIIDVISVKVHYLYYCFVGNCHCTHSCHDNDSDSHHLYI